jgi:hypothetical protein
MRPPPGAALASRSLAISAAVGQSRTIRGAIVPEQQQEGDANRELDRRHGGRPSLPDEPPPAPDGHGRGGCNHLRGEVVVEEQPAQTRAPCHRVRPLLPGAATSADPQVGIERASKQARVFAVDPGRDGLTQPVALHGV